MDKAGLDEIRDYTARECLTDSEWAALLSLAYEAVAAQERIDGWKREFQKVQAKRDAYRERAEQAEGRETALREALEEVRAWNAEQSDPWLNLEDIVARALSGEQGKEG